MRRPFAVTLVVLITSCSSGTVAVLPTREGPPPTAEVTLVWVGTGEAERLENGAWKRAESFDYEFTVEQRRYVDHWESVKHLRRRHPAYDGSAGPREQTMFFRVGFAPADAQGRVAVNIRSSLGDGEGSTDRAFRAATLVLHPDISKLAPFDTYRIAQSYQYEEGKLVETVSLDKGTAPWVRNQEAATLFAPHRFTEPPTSR